MRDGWNTAVALILYFIFASSSHVGPVAIPRHSHDATRSGEPPCWNRLVVASAAEVTIGTLSSGLVAYFLGGSITDRPARLRRQADSAYRLHHLRGRPSRPVELTATAPGRTSVVSNPKQLSKPLRATPKPAHVLTFGKGILRISRVIWPP